MEYYTDTLVGSHHRVTEAETNLIIPASQGALYVRETRLGTAPVTHLSPKLALALAPLKSLCWLESRTNAARAAPFRDHIAAWHKHVLMLKKCLTV